MHLQANGAAKDGGVSPVQALSGLSLKEEHDMRVEHALDILKADVSRCILSRCCISFIHDPHAQTIHGPYTDSLLVAALCAVDHVA